MVKGVVSCTPVPVGEEGSNRKRTRDAKDFVFDKKRTKL